MSVIEVRAAADVVAMVTTIYLMGQDGSCAMFQY